MVKIKEQISSYEIGRVVLDLVWRGGGKGALQRSSLLKTIHYKMKNMKNLSRLRVFGSNPWLYYIYGLNNSLWQREIRPFWELCPLALSNSADDPQSHTGRRQVTLKSKPVAYTTHVTKLGYFGLATKTVYVVVHLCLGVYIVLWVFHGILVWMHSIVIISRFHIFTDCSYWVSIFLSR